jgi:arylsulfatase A-like enzyme
VVAGPYLRSKFGFNQGWDDYDDYSIRLRGKRATTVGSVTPRQHRKIVEKLDSREDRPFFLFLHYSDVHYDYNPPEPWRSKFDPDYSGDLEASFFTSNENIHPEMDPRDLEHVRALYDGEVDFTDHYLGLLFEALRERDLYEDSLIVVTSDHGDEFFEHSHKGHRVNLYNSALKIPLIIKFPQSRWGGQRAALPTSLVDIAPTVFDLLGSDLLATVNGTSLVQLIQKVPARRLAWCLPICRTSRNR